MKTVITLATAIAIIYCFAAGLLYVFQRSLLYFPTPELNHPYERLRVESDGETIEVIVVNARKDNALLYFGGNAEAVVANANEFAANFAERTVYMVNYRGYGGSSGLPSEEGINRDALRVYDEIRDRHTNISVAGRSLGSGVATYLAANRAIERLVLITPYDSILNVARAKFAIFPISVLLKDRYDSLSRANSIDVPVLVLAAENDTVIPPRHTRRLAKAFADRQIELVTIANAGHNDLSDSKEYLRALTRFLE
ncbi:MAG: alpha/beta hydrolase [Pseudomonadota bacterium]